MSHQPRKRFGQHFLQDQLVIDRIVRAIDPKVEEHLVEIGPGLGAITLPILKAVGHLEAVEIDRDVIRTLQEISSGVGKLRIHEGDALRFDFGSLREQKLLRLIGNLPYNISTPLLFHLIDQRQHLSDMHFMLQKEVVERMAASPGSEHYGRLTVMLTPWVSVMPLFDIGPGAFRPPPRVVSTLVRLTPHATPPFVISDYSAYAKIVSAGFAQRRKTLRNALKPLLSAADIAAAGIDPGLRAEVLSPPQFAALAAAMNGTQPPPDEPAETSGDRRERL